MSFDPFIRFFLYSPIKESIYIKEIKTYGPPFLEIAPATPPP